MPRSRPRRNPNAMMHAEFPLFVGIMSGTSADGIDIGIVRFVAQAGCKPELIRFFEYPMPDKLRVPILRLAKPGINEIDVMGELGSALGKAYASAALAAINHAGLNVSDIAAIGCHGQTIRHQPHAATPFTLQIGCAATIAERTGITTVSDFRSRDIAAGGEGAPLAPFAHHQLFGSTDKSIAVLNIGGIANITWLGADGSVTGFDTGPGNMVMDGLMLAISDGRESFDKNGELAASGQVCAALLNTLMAHPFLGRKPPKSTGREEFSEAVIDRLITWPDISDVDRLATACRFTTESIAASRQFLPDAPQQWLVCGGGVRNNYLMQTLRRALAPAEVMSTDSAGMTAQAVEAASFAILARQTLMGQANTIARVTGASRCVCSGQITPGHNWGKLLQDIPNWTR